MPRYFFDVIDGENALDVEGVELPDLEAARIEGARREGEVLARHAETFWQRDEWRLICKDASGLILFTVDVIANDSPATMFSGSATAATR